MTELTEQERADLNGMMRVNFSGGKLASYVLMHFCIGRILGEADSSIAAHKKAIGQQEFSDETVSKLIDSLRALKQARISLSRLAVHIAHVFSQSTGIPNDDAVKMVGELARPHHAPSCQCGMHEAQALEVTDVG